MFFVLRFRTRFEATFVALCLPGSLLLTAYGSHKQRPKVRKVKKLLPNLCFKTSICEICSVPQDSR